MCCILQTLRGVWELRQLVLAFAAGLGARLKQTLYEGASNVRNLDCKPDFVRYCTVQRVRSPPKAAVMLAGHPGWCCCCGANAFLGLCDQGAAQASLVFLRLLVCFASCSILYRHSLTRDQDQQQNSWRQRRSGGKLFDEINLYILDYYLANTRTPAWFWHLRLGC